MASEWFYQAMGQQIGPVSAADLRNLAQRGTIAADTLVRKGPDGSWVPAQRVQGLFSTANITPPSRPFMAQPNEQPSAPPPINRATANASATPPTTFVGDTPQKPSNSERPEDNDFTKWLRQNIRQTLIAWPIIATLIALLVVAVTSEPGGARGWALAGQVLGAWAICLLVVPFGLLAFWLYFLPTIEAKRRNHPHYFGILTLNLGLGWTFLGWLGALVWARMIREGGNCWRCNARLNGFPMVCQFCQAELTWDQGRSRAP